MLFISRSIKTHISRLQVRARGALSAQRIGGSVSSASQRALMRWAIIREVVRKDWWKYANKLQEGSSRWRSWFTMWRTAGRYIALRELLLCHVGYEGLPDGDDSNSVRYAHYETLLIDQMNRDQSDVGEKSPSRPKFTIPRYEGRGILAYSVMQAAEIMLADKMRGECTVHPVSLSPMAVRALYAIQLELDTLLPVQVSAMCRIWAEERVRLRGGDTDVRRQNAYR